MAACQEDFTAFGPRPRLATESTFLGGLEPWGGWTGDSRAKHVGLPSGRPAREAVKEGNPGGLWEEVHEWTLKKELDLSSVGQFGEASANYLLRCGGIEKVAPDGCLRQKKLFPQMDGISWRNIGSSFPPCCIALQPGCGRLQRSGSKSSSGTAKTESLNRISGCRARAFSTRAFSI